MFTISFLIDIIGFFHLFSQTVLQLHEKRSVTHLEIILIRWLIFIIFYYSDNLLQDLVDTIPLGSIAYVYLKIQVFFSKTTFHIKLFKKLIQKTNFDVLTEVVLSIAGRGIIRLMHRMCQFLKKFDVKVSPSDYVLLRDISQFLETYDPKLSMSVLDSSTMSERDDALVSLINDRQQQQLQQQDTGTGTGNIGTMSTTNDEATAATAATSTNQSQNQSGAQKTDQFDFLRELEEESATPMPKPLYSAQGNDARDRRSDAPAAQPERPSFAAYLAQNQDQQRDHISQIIQKYTTIRLNNENDAHAPPLQEYYMNHENVSVQTMLEKSIYLNSGDQKDALAKELLRKKFTNDQQKQQRGSDIHAPAPNLQTDQKGASGNTSSGKKAAQPLEQSIYAQNYSGAPK